MLSNLCPTCVCRGKTFETQGSDTLRHRNLACPEPKLAAGEFYVLSPSTTGQAMVASSSAGNSTCRGQLNYLTATSVSSLKDGILPVCEFRQDHV